MVKSFVKMKIYKIRYFLLMTKDSFRERSDNYLQNMYYLFFKFIG